MAAMFTAASTQYLTNATPAVITFPVSVAMWVNLRAVSTVTRSLWSISDTATTTNFMRVQMSTTEILGVTASDTAGGALTQGLATAITAGSWNFVVARFISATNRRIAALYANGLIEVANSTTSRAPAGLDTSTIGAHQDSSGVLIPWDGMIGEFWLTNTDIGLDSAANIPNDLLRQLAFGGPFSMPHIADDIIEYRSFRKYPSSAGDEVGEVYIGPAGRQIWTNTNGVTMGWHPPLPYWYVKPGQVQTELVI